MVAGFQIKAEFAGSVIADEPWFNDLAGSYTGFSAGGGATEFQAPSHNLVIGDLITILSATGTSLDITLAEVTTTLNANTFTIAGEIAGDGTGNWFRYENVTWTDSTPKGPFSGSEGFLREIHIQFSTSSSVVVEVTLDGGATFLPLNNNAGIFGLATFTMFVKALTELNFRSDSATTVDITITGD